MSKKICTATRTKVHQAKTLDASRFTPDAGAGTALGEVTDYGETRTATLLVGLEKGKHDANNEGACARRPNKFSVGEADRAFETGRLMQVGEKNVAATRRTGKGWFEGRPEKSVAYEIVFIPSDAEPTYPDFIANVNKLAAAIGGGLCQDSVLVVHDDSDKRHTVAALRDPAVK